MTTMSERGEGMGVRRHRSGRHPFRRGIGGRAGGDEPRATSQEPKVASPGRPLARRLRAAGEVTQACLGGEALGDVEHPT